MFQVIHPECLTNASSGLICRDGVHLTNKGYGILVTGIRSAIRSSNPHGSSQNNVIHSINPGVSSPNNALSQHTARTHAQGPRYQPSLSATGSGYGMGQNLRTKYSGLQGNSTGYKSTSSHSFTTLPSGTVNMPVNNENNVLRRTQILL